MIRIDALWLCTQPQDMRAGAERLLTAVVNSVGRAQAYHGYHYRILTAQGQFAQGGAYDYRIKGRMIGGFALIAFPARWGVSGVMSFVCNHDGAVYEKNLGRDTLAQAKAITRFDPDSTWVKATP